MPAVTANGRSNDSQNWWFVAWRGVLTCYTELAKSKGPKFFEGSFCNKLVWSTRFPDSSFFYARKNSGLKKLTRECAFNFCMPRVLLMVFRGMVWLLWAFLPTPFDEKEEDVKHNVFLLYIFSSNYFEMNNMNEGNGNYYYIKRVKPWQA